MQKKIFTILFYFLIKIYYRYVLYIKYLFLFFLYIIPFNKIKIWNMFLLKFDYKKSINWKQFIDFFLNTKYRIYLFIFKQIKNLITYFLIFITYIISVMKKLYIQLCTIINYYLIKINYKFVIYIIYLFLFFVYIITFNKIKIWTRSLLRFNYNKFINWNQLIDLYIKSKRYLFTMLTKYLIQIINLFNKYIILINIKIIIKIILKLLFIIIIILLSIYCINIPYTFYAFDDIIDNDHHIKKETNDNESKLESFSNWITKYKYWIIAGGMLSISLLTYGTYTYMYSEKIEIPTPTVLPNRIMVELEPIEHCTIHLTEDENFPGRIKCTTSVGEPEAIRVRLKYNGIDTEDLRIKNLRNTFVKELINEWTEDDTHNKNK